MVRYTYNQQVTPPAPAGVEVPAQVDTAAELSVIPARFVDELRLVPLDIVSALGFGGHLLTLPTYLVELRIRGLDPITVKVLASHDEPYALLGRDMLNRHTILLDGPNLVLEVR
jgi:predicted aspartyl protease